MVAFILALLAFSPLASANSDRDAAPQLRTKYLRPVRPYQIRPAFSVHSRDGKDGASVASTAFDMKMKRVMKQMDNPALDRAASLASKVAKKYDGVVDKKGIPVDPRQLRTVGKIANDMRSNGWSPYHGRALLKEYVPTSDLAQGTAKKLVDGRPVADQAAAKVATALRPGFDSKFYNAFYKSKPDFAQGMSKGVAQAFAPKPWTRQ